ncbi:MAG: LD-carboxypeptidase [Rickettsiaceae bacterium]|nr:LD-carboxypeptidase [Rickettsiaceae bacterium]
MKVKLIAPSSGLGPKQNREEILDKIVKIMHEYGIEVIYNPRILTTTIEEKKLPYFADSKEFREQDLKESIESYEYDIIWTLRGGYGCLDSLYNIFRTVNTSHNKILIGYSDTTALHIFINNYLNWPSIYGPSLLDIANAKATYESIDTILSSNSTRYSIEKIYGDFGDPKISKISKVIGGNLTVLTTVIGTLPTDFRDTIVFFEDVGEAPYAVHRSLSHLKNAGLLNGAYALLFGDFIKNSADEADAEFDELMNSTIAVFCADIGIPSFRIEGIGHRKSPKAICFGTNAKISTYENNSDMFFLEVSSIRVPGIEVSSIGEPGEVPSIGEPGIEDSSI